MTVLIKVVAKTHFERMTITLLLTTNYDKLVEPKLICFSIHIKEC
jgi:hypothetical protein